MTTPAHIPAPDPTPTMPTLAAGIPDITPAADIMPKDVLKRAKQVAKELKKFIRSNPGIVCEIEGRKFPMVEAWQFVAACYGYTPMVSATNEVQSEKGEELGFKAIAHLANGQGRIVSAAEGMCLRSEPEWTGKPSFQVLSMAQTRACAKVDRNIFAFVMILAGLAPTPAEEISGPHQYGKQGHSQNTGKKCHECGNQISDALYAKTRRKYWKALCVTHKKVEDDAKEEQIMQPINDPKLVEKSIAQVQERKASQSQPIIAAMEGGDDDEDWDDEPVQANGWRDFR